MKTSHIKEKLVQRFPPGENFSREDLYTFYRQFEPDLKASALGGRIYELKKKDIIKPIRTGVYSVSDRHLFTPNLDNSIRRINSRLKDAFSNVNYNLWSTGWLAEFSRHQPMVDILIVETERDSIESMFFYLKDEGFKNVFLKPDANMMEKYISEEKQAIIVKPMISRAPTRRVEKIQVPTLEKILVDLFCDEVTFYAYRGNELVNIFDHAFKYYAVNFSRLFSYAKRRRREKPLWEFFKKHFSAVLNHLSR